MPMSGSQDVGSNPQLGAPSHPSSAWPQAAVEAPVEQAATDAPPPPAPKTFAENTGYDLEVVGQQMTSRNLDEATPADANRDPADAEIDADPVAQQMIAQLERMGMGPTHATELDAPGQAQTQPPSTTPETDASVATTGADAPGAPLEPTPEEAPPVPSAGSTLSVDFGTYGKVDLDVDYAKELLLQDAWIKQKPEQSWQTLGAIERGEVFTVTADDYALLQRAKSGELAPPQAPPRLSDDEAAYLSPEALAHVRRLEALQAKQAPVATQYQTAPGIQPQYVDPQSVARQTAFEIDRANRIQAITDAGVAEFKKLHSLTEDEWSELSGFVNHGQHVYRAVQRNTVRNPDGSEAYVDHEKALREGLDEAYMVHPKFRERMIAAEAQRRLDASTKVTTAANEKKTRASSLAAAPSAAITTPSSTPGEQSHQDRVALIAAEIRESRRAGTG